MGAPDDQYAGTRPPASNLGNLLVIGVLTASHRLRRWAGYAALWMLGLGGILLALTIAANAQDYTAFSLVVLGFGALLAVYWLIATVLAWIVDVVAEDLREGRSTRRRKR